VHACPNDHDQRPLLSLVVWLRHALPANWAEVLKAISPQAIAPADPPAK